MATVTMFDLSPSPTAIPQKTRQFYFPPHETQILVGCGFGLLTSNVKIVRVTPFSKSLSNLSMLGKILLNLCHLYFEQVLENVKHGILKAVLLHPNPISHE